MLAALNRAAGHLTEDAQGWCGPCEETPGGLRCPEHENILDAAGLLLALNDALESGDTAKVAELLGMGETR